ncbi:restriction endonuclease [Novacetimonas maltaceti]|nr:restriction endonuclease [Novacetimonas maltaceti]
MLATEPCGGRGKTEKNMRIWAFACLLLCLPVHAQAGSAYRVKHPTVACGDDLAIKALNDRTNPHLTDPQWRQAMMVQGQCYTVAPDMRWEKIANRNGLPLLRRNPAVPGMPPLYFMASDISDISAPPPAAPGKAADGPTPLPTPAMPAEGTDPQATDNAASPQAAPVIIAHTDPPAPTDLFFMTGGFQKLGSMLLSALLALGAGWILWVVYRMIMAFVGRRAALRQATALVERNAGLLIQRRLHAHEGQAAHGKTPAQQWQGEVGRFCRTTLLPALAHDGREQYWPAIERKVQARIEAVSTRARPRPDLRLVTSSTAPYHADMTSAQYVSYCMGLLEKADWDTRLSGNAGQAATVIVATKDGLSMVVQCWTERRPVEEETVRQCIAARAGLSARIAVVVSNAPYTQQAIQLGKSSRVFVLHHEELQKFASQVEAPQVA